MLLTRVIPCLLLRKNGLVKTIKFRNPSYVGDPINTVRIFNEKEVDEMIVLDITATVEKREPNFKMIGEIATECFMPFCYGGGVNSIATLDRLFSLGVEKVAINSAAMANRALVTEAAGKFGSQAVVVSIDVKTKLLGGYEVVTHSGTRMSGLDPVRYATMMEQAGAGEILLTSIDRDGTFSGYDLDLVKQVTATVSIPVIACGGASRVADFGRAVNEAGASAVAAGSMVMYQGENRAVLINFPTPGELATVLDRTI